MCVQLSRHLYLYDICFLCDALKGQSKEIFDLHLFVFESATDQWVKIFTILVKISWNYSNFRFKKLNHRGMIPQGVMFRRVFYWIAGVWYSMEIDSSGYHTPGRLTRWCIIHKGDLKKLITERILNQNRKYFYR